MKIATDHILVDRLKEDLFTTKDVAVSIARLDLIHPHVSGNKIFKLHYFLEECIASAHKTLLTFGGAWSNHLAATAYACREKKIRSIGVVRGERPAKLSDTLQQCGVLGMQLHFISREAYKDASDPKFISSLREIYGDFTFVPEGGYSPEGAKGASLINALLQEENATHLVTAVGTATTLAGLMIGKGSEQEIIGIPVIKNMTDIQERIKFLTGNANLLPTIFNEYHFGGYAKYDAKLIAFMNEFYRRHQVPTDIVYTCKMLFAITDKIKDGYFPRGSRIVCLHTGGLQGNASLAPGTLIF